MRAVIAVAGEAVKFPNQHHIEQLLLAVLYNVLKLRSVCGSGGQGSVDVAAENGDTVSFGVLRTFTKLPFYAFNLSPIIFTLFHPIFVGILYVELAAISIAN